MRNAVGSSGAETEKYEVIRRHCLLEQDEDKLQFVIQVQDCAHKYNPKNLIISVPIEVYKRMTSYQGGSNF